MENLKETPVSFMRKRVDDDLLAPPLESADHAYRLFKQMENEATEKLVCLYLTDKYEIISFEVVAIGTGKNLLEPQEIVRSASLLRARRIVIVYNQPSGPSKITSSDMDAAIDLKRVAEAMRIRLQDMLIIRNGTVISLSYNGVI